MSGPMVTKRQILNHRDTRKNPKGSNQANRKTRRWTFLVRFPDMGGVLSRARRPDPSVELRYPSFFGGLWLQALMDPTKKQAWVVYGTYLWLVGNGGMVVIVVTIVPHSSIPY